jgi:hypothetical protein
MAPSGGLSYHRQPIGRWDLGVLPDGPLIERWPWDSFGDCNTIHVWSVSFSVYLTRGQHNVTSQPWIALKRPSSSVMHLLNQLQISSFSDPGIGPGTVGFSVLYHILKGLFEKLELSSGQYRHLALSRPKDHGR